MRRGNFGVCILMIGLVLPLAFGCKKEPMTAPIVPVSLSTKPAINITRSTATSGGTIISEGSSAVTSRGICWSKSETPTLADSKTVDGFGSGPFESKMEGLSPGTTYTIRAYASTVTTTTYALKESFTTLPAELPTLTTAVVTNITKVSALGGGSVTADGGAVVIARGICWGTSATPTINDSKTTDGSGTGTYTSSLTGLSPGTTYNARAYATNIAGTAYGDIYNFAAVDPPTKVTIKGYSGTINAPFLTRDGGYLFFSNGHLQYAARISDSSFDYKGEIVGAHVPPFNVETYPSMDAAGTLFFQTDVPYLLSPTFTSTFSAGAIKVIVPFQDISTPGVTRARDEKVEVDASGEYIYYVHYETSGPATAKHLQMAKKSGALFVSNCCDFLKNIVSGADVYGVGSQNYEPSVSGDGLELFFTQKVVPPLSNSSTGAPPTFKLLVAKRNNVNEAFGTPVVIPLNGVVSSPAISADRKVLYFVIGSELYLVNR